MKFSIYYIFTYKFNEVSPLWGPFLRAYYDDLTTYGEKYRYLMRVIT